MKTAFYPNTSNPFLVIESTGESQPGGQQCCCALSNQPQVVYKEPPRNGHREEAAGLHIKLKIALKYLDFSLSEGSFWSVYACICS